MPAAIFDSKQFNPELFGKYYETIPKLKRNELLKSGAINNAPQYKAMMEEQTGGNYITVAGHTSMYHDNLEIIKLLSAILIAKKKKAKQ